MVNKARSTSPMTIKVSSFMQTSYCVTTTLERLIMLISQIFLLKILPRKPSFFFLIWLIDMMSLYHTITCSHLKLIVFHWLCLPCFIHLEILINSVQWKKNFFWLKILSRKPSFYFLLWLIDMISLYSGIVTQLLVHI